MRKGFIFNEALCVNCRACVAACILENNWETGMRSLFVYNSQINTSLPVLNLSLACNHCANAACLDGCPAKAIFRHPTTGAVIIDDSKCIGCNYCSWNCPYDAPRNSTSGKVAVKCNLCFELTGSGNKPACANGCPTGAMEYGEIAEVTDNSGITWFPDKGLNPAIEISCSNVTPPLKIIPPEKFCNDLENVKQVNRDISKDWSLIGFTFLSLLSVSLTLTDFLTGKTSNNLISIWLIIIAGAFSIFHLGTKIRAWRAVLNILRSPLSLEIVAYTGYSGLLTLSVLTDNPWRAVSATVFGILLMLSIDSVYGFSDRKGKQIFHSGQVFLSALLITSYLSGFILAFLFLALIKAVISVYLIIRTGNRHWSFGLRFIRIVLLIVASGVMVSGIVTDEKLFILLFLAGEFADRLLFYVDFNPININTLITYQINNSLNEKKRG